MPQKHAQEIAESLRRSARTSQGYLGRLEKLHKANRLSQRDVTRAYEGAFLSYYTALERHLEQLFLGLLMSRIVVSGRPARSLVRTGSDVTARRIVAGDRPYADWLPIDHTAKRAKKLLSGGRPFDRLSKVDTQVLEQMRIVRNAVAHKSSYATRRFHREFIEGNGIPPLQRTPAGYLRGQHAEGQTRLGYFMAQGVNTMNRLCA
jgi:hypothetical protein